MMPSRSQVLSVLGPAPDYPAVGRRLGVPPGLVYLIATGLPADGGDALAPEDLARPGLLPGSTQHLANPEADIPKESPRVRRWMASRAGGDAAMQAAAEARNAEPAEPVDTDDTDVTAVLGRDHGRINAMLEELSAIPGVRQGGSDSDLSRRHSIVDMITVAASRHEAVEEEHFWPTVSEILPGGEGLAQEAIDQEQQGAETLAALAKLSGREDEFDELVERLVAQLRKHVATEDRVLLQVSEEVSEADRQAWGGRIRRAEKRAPTRPHPNAPRRPPSAVKAVGAAGAATDKVRDAVGSRPAERKGQASGPARRRSQRRDQQD
jgi:hemerythrin-like domain-containing protein